MSCGAIQIIDPGDGGLDLEVYPGMSPEQAAESLRWINGEGERPSDAGPPLMPLGGSDRRMPR